MLILVFMDNTRSVLIQTLFPVDELGFLDVLERFVGLEERIALKIVPQIHVPRRWLRGNWIIQ